MRTFRVGVACLALIAGGLTMAQSEPEMRFAPRAVQARLTLLPAGFTSFGAASQGAYIYMIGGHTAPAHEYFSEGFQTGFWRLNLADRSVEALPGGVSLQSVALVSDGARLIRVGGMHARNSRGAKHDLHSTAEVAAYDPLARAWSPLPALPEIRSSHDAICVDGKLYVFGGWKLSGEGDADTPWHESGAVLDLRAEKPEWKPVAQPFRKRALAVAAVAGRIYAIGGMTPEGMSATTDLFDPATGEWSEGPAVPGMAFGTSACEFGGRCYTTTADGVVFSHAPGENAWRREGTLNYQRMFHRLIGCGTEIAVVAGTARGGHLRSIEWFKPGVKDPVVTRVTIPAPGSAKVRQGVFVHNGALYVFGGNNSTVAHQFRPENFLSESFRISLNDLSASRIATLPVQRQSFATFMHVIDRHTDPEGFAMGGFGHDGKSQVSQSEILRYDFVADRWETLKTTLPNPMTQFGHAYHNGKVYLFGGMDFDRSRGEAGQFAISDRVWVWDRRAEDELARNEFRPLEGKLRVRRRAFGGAEMNGRYYIVGGMTDRFEEVETCEAFNLLSGKSETIAAPHEPRISPKLVPLNGKLYLIGGTVQTERGSETCRRIDVYDPEHDVWRVAVLDIGFNPGELQAFAVGNRIVIYSAHNEEGLINLAWVTP